MSGIVLQRRATPFFAVSSTIGVLLWLVTWQINRRTNTGDRVNT